MNNSILKPDYIRKKKEREKIVRKIEWDIQNEEAVEMHRSEKVSF